jgi:phage shock protein C
MYCNACGKLIQDDANVCAYCGRSVLLGTGHRRKLTRPRAGRKVAGVCMGFAEYFDIDITLMRLLWLLAGILTFPMGEIAYLVAWIVMPEDPPALPAASAVSDQPSSRPA